MAERYIKVSDLINELGKHPDIYETIDNTPEADVEEVVRCEKCKDFEPHGNRKAGICRNRKLKPCLRHDTDFCSYGQRK